MDNREKALYVLEKLRELYPDGKCGLNWGGDPFHLFVMAVLSAQCKDERVNLVSKKLFEALPDVEAFAKSKEGVLEELIRSVGLYNSKSRNLREASKMICSEFGGEIPSAMDDLLSLPGVGRKVANLLRGDIFGLGGIVADTHCIRICGRLGCTEKNDPLVTERVMSSLVPVEHQSEFCHNMVSFGRDVCSARSPQCGECVFSQICAYCKR